jgi:hypothetical protein
VRSLKPASETSRSISLAYLEPLAISPPEVRLITTCRRRDASPTRTQADSSYRRRMRVGVKIVFAALGGVISFAPVHAQKPAPSGPSAPSSPREGTITVVRGSHGGTAASGVDAVFSTSSQWGTVEGSDGPCTAYKRAPAAGLSAGTIRISGTTEPITLDESHASTGLKYRAADRVPTPSFGDGATITVESTGGADIPAFSSSVTAPTSLAGYTPPKILSRSGYTATWTPGSGGTIMVAIHAGNPRTHTGDSLICRVEDTGAFTVPATAFALIPLSDDHAILMVGRVAETTLTAADVRVMIDAISFVGSGPFPLASSDHDVGGSVPETNPQNLPGGHIARAVSDDEPQVHKFLILGWGMGGWSRLSNAAPSAGQVVTLQVGQRLRPRLHLVEEVDLVVGGAYSPDPTVTEDHGSLLVGVRWSPFRSSRRAAPPSFIPGRYGAPLAFYLRAAIGAGFNERATLTNDSVRWSPIVSAALGYLPAQGRDWALGMELREQVMHFSEGFQRDWAFVLIAQLFD